MVIDTCGTGMSRKFVAGGYCRGGTKNGSRTTKQSVKGLSYKLFEPPVNYPCLLVAGGGFLRQGASRPQLS